MGGFGDVKDTDEPLIVDGRCWGSPGSGSADVQGQVEAVSPAPAEPYDILVGSNRSYWAMVESLLFSFLVDHHHFFQWLVFVLFLSFFFF